MRWSQATGASTLTGWRRWRGYEFRRASLDEAKAATGFVAGGTPPFGYLKPLRVFADLQLKRHDLLWAAAGTPDSVFSIQFKALDESVCPVWGDISQYLSSEPG